MSEGRLIRVSKFRGDPQVVGYLVALPDKAQALKIIRDRVAMPEDEIEDLGRVSENLLNGLLVSVGNILPRPRCSASRPTATAESAESCAQGKIAKRCRVAAAFHFDELTSRRYCAVEMAAEAGSIMTVRVDVDPVGDSAESGATTTTVRVDVAERPAVSVAT